MQKRIELIRTSQNDKQTLGILTVYDENNLPIYSGISLERGWLDIQKNTSCVPLGIYDIVLEYSPRFNMDLWELKGVPTRSECKIHSANYWYELNGCISLGVKLVDMDRDGYYDVTSSKNSVRAFMAAMRGLKKSSICITKKLEIYGNHEIK